MRRMRSGTEVGPASPASFAGRYRVVERLGRGGMGAVYHVVDEAIGKHLALKRVLRRDTDLSFRREFHTMASLAHPRIVEVHDYGLHEGRPYYTMELLGGRDLKDRAPVSSRDACALLRDVASALSFLHARRLVHRDISPRNVRETEDGRAKLIDFGLIVSAGATAPVAGTPPFVAPESLRVATLDHRIDLFSLGALAYFMLAGKHAFPARGLDELHDLWRSPPPPLSSVANAVPPELEVLVSSLLSIDPLARPASAAEVIERASAIGDLPPEPETEAARGYLASAALVGRKKEMDRGRRRIERAMSNDGHAIRVEAPSGAGKTRLLRELCFEAQLAGAKVARAEAGAEGSGPYALLRTLARELLACAREEAFDAAEPHLPVLARVVPELRLALGDRKPKLLGDPAEDRILVQASLRDWILSIADRAPLVLAVDDAQRADEASAAVLAGSAHAARGHPLLILVTVRSDEEPRAPGMMAALADAAVRMPLRGLSEPDVEDLVRSLFGDETNVARLAQFLHRMAGGSPLLCTELARHLTETGVIRHVGGTWLIPDRLSDANVPSALADAMDARVSKLDARAKTLAQALSTHGGSISLELAVELAESRVEEVLDDLDVLTREEVLVRSDDGYRFRHDGLREAIERSTSPERRRLLHLRVGRALSARLADEPDREADVGWHLLRGGEEIAGAEMLHAAAARSVAAQGFADAIPMAEAALEVHLRHGSSERRELDLRRMLLLAGSMHDRECALRHVASTVAGFRKWAGVNAAEKLRRWCGKHLAFVLGTAWATMRWLCARPSRRGPPPWEALRDFVLACGYGVGVHATSYDEESARALVRSMEPVALFRGRAPYAIYLFTASFCHLLRGEVSTVLAHTAEVERTLREDTLTPIRDIERRAGIAGAHHMRALLAIGRTDVSLDEELAAIDACGVQYFQLAALHARMIHHRLRGEEDRVAELAPRAEQMALQLGSTWQLESLLPVAAGFAFALTRDVVGMRRTVEQLEALARDGRRIQPFIAAARGDYLRERGQLTEAEASYRAAAAAGRPVEPVARIGLAETFLAAGRIEEAESEARIGTEQARDPDLGHRIIWMRGERVLALSQAAGGACDEAAKRLDRTIAAAEELDNPLLAGALHEARARVALLAGEHGEASLHSLACEASFRRTQNPVLIARAERLAEALRAPALEHVSGDGEADVTAVERRAPDVSAIITAEMAGSGAHDPSTVSAMLASCRGPHERARRALDLILEAAGAERGYLFVATERRLEVVAPGWGLEPPEEIARRLAAYVHPAGDAETMPEPRVESERTELPWVPIVLRTSDGRPVAAVAAFEGAVPVTRPDTRLVEAIAAALDDVVSALGPHARRGA